MGVIEKVTCSACKREWECQTGCGLMHGRLEAVARLFEDKTEEILAYQAMDEFPLYDFGYQLGNCTKCYDVVSVPTLKMLKSNTEYIGTCPRCKGAVSLIQDIEQTPCVICGKKALKKVKTGHWD